jgi:hypothetical protein
MSARRALAANRSYALPVEQVRALVRLLYPEHMTPVAKRQIESACDAAEQAPVPTLSELLDIEVCPCSLNTTGLTRRQCAERNP